MNEARDQAKRLKGEEHFSKENNKYMTLRQEHEGHIIVSGRTSLFSKAE